MQNPQKLQEENERLKAELAQSQAETEAYKAAATKPPIIKRIQYAIFKPIEGILSFLFNTFKSFLDGRIFLGVVLTLGIAGFGYLAYAYGSLSLFIGVAVLLTFIAWVFYMLKERAFQRQQEQFQQKLQQFSNSEDTPTLPLLLVNIIHSKTSAQRQQHAQQIKSEFKRLQPYLLDSVKFVKAYATKFLAFNSFLSLFTLLTSISIGIIAFLQLEKFERQNQLFEGQNELFKIQNQRVTEQTALMRSQDSLLRTQNRFLQRQLGQVDTQNLYIIEQIKQASIQNKLVTAQNKRLDQQTYLQEAERRGSLVFLLGDILNDIDLELKDSSNQWAEKRALSPQLMSRIISLNSRFKPYKYLEGDNLIKKPLSPERGQLLLYLYESKLYRSTYEYIFSRADFSYADLKGAQLQNAYLKGINLSYADLTGALLYKAILDETTFDGAILDSAYLGDVRFYKSSLKNASFRKTDFRRANILQSNFENSNFTGAFFEKITIEDNKETGMFVMSSFKNANLSYVNFTNSNLFFKADFTDAILDNAQTSDPYLFKRLEEIKVKGIEGIKKRYYVDIKESITFDSDASNRYLLFTIRKSHR